VTVNILAIQVVTLHNIDFYIAWHQQQHYSAA